MTSIQFWHLPFEIRVCIWRMSLSQRVITTAHHHVFSSPNATGEGDDNAGDDDTTDNVVATTRFWRVQPPPLPPTVRVSREARNETLPLYPWVSIDMGDRDRPTPSVPFRFNCAIDQLLVVSRCGGHRGPSPPTAQDNEEAEGKAAFLLLRAVCGIMNRVPGRSWSCNIRHLAIETHLFAILRRTTFYHTSPEATSAMDDFLRTVRETPTLETCTFYQRLDLARLHYAAGDRKSTHWRNIKSFRLAKKPLAKGGGAGASDTSPGDELRRVGAVLASPQTAPQGDLALFSILESSTSMSQTAEVEVAIASLSSAGTGAFRGDPIVSHPYPDEGLGYCLRRLLHQMGEKSDEPHVFAHGICMPNYGFTHVD